MGNENSSITHSLPIVIQEQKKVNLENIVELKVDDNQHVIVLARLPILLITDDDELKKTPVLHCKIGGVGKIIICLPVPTVLSTKEYQKFQSIKPQDYKVWFYLAHNENLAEKILMMYPSVYKRAFALGAQTLLLEKMYPLLPLFISTVQTDPTYLQELNQEMNQRNQMIQSSDCDLIEISKQSYLSTTKKPSKYELLREIQRMYLSVSDTTIDKKPIALKTQEFDEKAVIVNFIEPVLQLYRSEDQAVIFEQLYHNACFFFHSHIAVVDIDHILNQTQLTQEQKDERITVYLEKCLQTPEYKRRKSDPGLKMECIGIASNTIRSRDKIGHIRNLLSDSSQKICDIVEMGDTIYVYFEGLGFDNPHISLWNTCHWLHSKEITAKPMGVCVEKYESVFVGRIPEVRLSASEFSGANVLDFERGNGIGIAHLDALYTDCQLVREKVRTGGFNALNNTRITEQSHLWAGNENYTSLKTLEQHATKTLSVIIDVAPHANVIGYPCVSGSFAPVLLNPRGDFQCFCYNLTLAANNNDVHVISVSLAAPWPFLGEGWGLKATVEEIRRKNKIMIAASGQFPTEFGKRKPLYPACFSAVVAEMGCKHDTTAWEHSAYKGDGTGLAEGVIVTSIDIDAGRTAQGYYPNRETVGNGTSYATAATAGIAAIFLQHKRIELEQIKAEYNGEGVYFVDIFKYLLHRYAQEHNPEHPTQPIRYYKYPIDDIAEFLNLPLPTIAEVKRFMEVENADEHITTIRNKLNIPMGVGTDFIWDELRWLDITYLPQNYRDQRFRMLIDEYHALASDVVKEFLQPYRLQQDANRNYTYQLAPFKGVLDKFVGFYKDELTDSFHVFFNKEGVLNTESGNIYCKVWPLRAPYVPPNFIVPESADSIYGPWANFPGIVYITNNRTRLSCLIYHSGTGPRWSAPITSVPFSYYLLSNELDNFARLQQIPFPGVFTIVRLASHYCAIHNVLHLCVVVIADVNPAETCSIFTISVCGVDFLNGNVKKLNPISSQRIVWDTHDWSFSFNETNGVVHLIHNATEYRLPCRSINGNMPF